MIKKLLQVYILLSVLSMLANDFKMIVLEILSTFS